MIRHGNYSILEYGIDIRSTVIDDYSKIPYLGLERGAGLAESLARRSADTEVETEIDLREGLIFDLWPYRLPRCFRAPAPSR